MFNTNWDWNRYPDRLETLFCPVNYFAQSISINAIYSFKCFLKEIDIFFKKIIGELTEDLPPIILYTSVAFYFRLNFTV